MSKTNVTQIQMKKAVNFTCNQSKIMYGTRQKEYNNLKKNCASLFDKKSRHTFMVCAGSAGIRCCCALCQTHRIFTAKGAAIKDGALRSGHQSVALLVAGDQCMYVYWLPEVFFLLPCTTAICGCSYLKRMSPH